MITLTREKGKRMWGGASEATYNGSNGGGSGGVSSAWVDGNYISKEFFNQLFRAKVKKHVVVTDPNDPDTPISDNTTVILLTPNEVPVDKTETDEETGYITTITYEIDNIQALGGLWTDSYISALGQNASGGGGGGGGASALYQLVDVKPNSSENPSRVYGLTGTSSDIGKVLTMGSDGKWYAGTIQQSGGTVTSITAGTGLTGGTITTSGTIAISSTYQTYIDNGNTAFSWGNHANAGYWKGSNHPSTISDYGINDLGFGTAGSDYVPVTIGSTTVNVLTSHQSLSGYATIAWVRNQDYADASWFDFYLPLSGGRMTGQLKTDDSGSTTEEPTTQNAALLVYGSIYVIKNSSFFREVFFKDNIKQTTSYTARFGSTTVQNIRIGGASGILIEYDSTNNALKVNGSIYATGGVSALGQSSGGGGGGATSLSDLVDVAISSPTNGQALVYDSTTNKWKNATVQSGGGSVTSITAGTGLSGGTITSSGTIAISSTYQTYINNGNTAYGWGNHANAGYLTGITYNMVTSALGYTPLSNVTTFWGQTASNNAVKGSLNQVISIEFSGVANGDGHGGFIDFHYNGSSSDYTSRIIEDAYGRIYLNATNGVRIGNAVLVWDSTNNALKVQKFNGAAANFYALGGVSALGFQAGSGATDSATISNLYIGNSNNSIYIDSDTNFMIFDANEGFEFTYEAYFDEKVFLKKFLKFTSSSTGKIYFGDSVYLYYDNNNLKLNINGTTYTLKKEIV